MSCSQNECKLLRCNINLPGTSKGRAQPHTCLFEVHVLLTNGKAFIKNSFILPIKNSLIRLCGQYTGLTTGLFLVHSIYNMCLSMQFVYYVWRAKEINCFVCFTLCMHWMMIILSGRDDLEYVCPPTTLMYQ